MNQVIAAIRWIIVSGRRSVENALCFSFKSTSLYKLLWFVIQTSLPFRCNFQGFIDTCVWLKVDVCVHALLVSSFDRQWLFVYFGGQTILFFIPFPLQPTCAIALALTYRIKGCQSNWLTPPTDSPATSLWPPACTAVGGSRCPQKQLSHPPLCINGLWWEQSLNTCHSQIHASSFFPLFLLESILQKHTAGLFLNSKNEKENRRPDVNTLNSLFHSLGRGPGHLWSRVWHQVYQHKKVPEED